MAPPPDPTLVAPLRRTIEPLVYPPESIQSARIGGVRVINHAILLHEGAHAWTVTPIGLYVGTARGGELFHRLRHQLAVHGVSAALVIVFELHPSAAAPP